ncbi:hypothetical protein FE257_001594 [Aspergillus nanangensis]|uniref:Xylanolytic transcriptional activator regulatory domain-containing protein n=1 Tax=Aspergillus nanangensis TaxID=2582783 RepID=A0AAD4CTM3_ASPNN|nr:hypothetical protein FE257_001594 [Aspergillus nanangensis]
MSTNDLRRKRPPAVIGETGAASMSPHAEDLSDHQSQDDHQPTTRELATRLNSIEQQLSLVLAALNSGQRVSNSESPTSRLRERLPLDSSTIPISKPHVPTFVGESSISHTLNHIEGYLQQRETGREQREYSFLRRRPSPSVSSLPASPMKTTREEYVQMTDSRKVLMKHEVVPDRARWDEFMRIFCDEVHILYPFLHLPTIWTNYTRMWDWNFEDGRIVTAQVWICVTLGRCTQSSRTSSEEGKHSAGWSLFEASVELIGDVLGCFRTCSNPTTVLQTLTLMVAYLFRLDANERAEKFLALTISHAHHLGYHRYKVATGMSVFDDEAIRRLWWCLYAMDRRLAIETGHPFLIQDINVDILHPRDLSDEWLSRHKDDPRISGELSDEIQTEIARDPITPIPYLVAMIRYSRVVGKIWETIYSAGANDAFPSPGLLEYLEQLLQGAQKEVRPEFSSQTGAHQPNSELWWRTKQRMLMRNRWLSLRLLIRKPILQQKALSSETKLAMLDNEINCIQIACQIIEEFKQVAEENTPSAYPFLHSLVGATVVSLGLILKQPSFKGPYGSITFHAASSLERFCHRTWVSGRMLRTIWRLKQMASRALCGGEETLPTRSRSRRTSEVPSASSNRRPDSVFEAMSVSNSLPPTVHPIEASATTTQDYQHHPMTLPPNLMMADFDFEETFINDIVPSHHGVSEASYSETQPGTANVEMEWLESLFGMDSTKLQ